MSLYSSPPHTDSGNLTLLAYCSSWHLSLPPFSPTSESPQKDFSSGEGHPALLTPDFLPQGTYGTVFKAKNRETHEIVALKRVRLDDDDEVGSFWGLGGLRV